MKLSARAQSWVETVVRSLMQRGAVRRGPLATWLAAGTFVVVSVVAVATFPYEASSVHWTKLLWTGLVLVPATALLNGLEFHLGARLMSLSVTLRESFRVGLYGSAANNLPIPGAVMVRVGAMARLGSKLSRAGSVTVATGLLWIASACTVAGLIVSIANPDWLSFVLLISGVAVAASTFIYLLRSSSSDHRVFLVVGLVAVEVALVGVTAMRFHVALSALGVNATPTQSVVLALSVVVAAAIGVLPAGLGIREVIAGLLAPLVSIEPSLGLAATVIDRTVAMVGLAVLTVIVGVDQLTRPGIVTPEAPE